jgi:hypothetical protein
MNPLMNGSNTANVGFRPKMGDNYGLEEQKPTTELASIDAAYESFMKEIGKFL